jgi:hypothetical protein
LVVFFLYLAVLSNTYNSTATSIESMYHLTTPPPPLLFRLDRYPRHRNSQTHGELVQTVAGAEVPPDYTVYIIKF